MTLVATSQILDGGSGAKGLRDQILTTLYGRRDGLDFNNFEVGPKDMRVQIEVMSSTSGTLSNFGISCLSCTTSTTAIYTMPAGSPGVQGKQIIMCTTTATATGCNVQAASGVNFVTTGGSSFNQMNFTVAGAYQELTSISSALWVTKNTANSGVTFSTF